MLARLLERIQTPATDDSPETTVELAAAVLLVEVAWADHHVADAELRAIERSLKAVLQISGEDLRALIDESRKAQRESVGLHRFTRAIVDAWSAEQRFELLVQLWRLAYCDAGLDKYEEATVRKIADLLYVDHPRFIAAKLKAKQLVAVS
ncbi:MAG: TerB family tellurite resistance protein [Gammaproteobacteria bacterium]|nr:TerB family tellurite resistance protein [Gammaproteobacteria bacterium]MYG14074.1 TerB family tellurite resistance protein [Gammaproteobacteria bacterium]MYK29043.1 TerB family tellurite resistance protein [Gammaproteobacteria bacterium]